jgi:hypothetical protein
MLEQAEVLQLQVQPAVHAAVVGNCSCALHRHAAAVVAAAESPLSCRQKMMWETQESEISFIINKTDEPVVKFQW